MTLAWSMQQPTQMALFCFPSVLCTLSWSWEHTECLCTCAAASSPDTVEGAYGGTACSVPEQTALVLGLSICSFHQHEKQAANQESRARIALVPFIGSLLSPHTYTRKPSKHHSPCLSLSSLSAHLEGGGCHSRGHCC